MKTKILKSKGYWKLVVQDEEVNKKYNASNEEPIVLGTLTEFFDIGYWGLEDYRLKENLIPAQFLQEGMQSYLPENNEEKEKILESLKVYEINENGNILWPLFDSFAFDGDKTDYTNKPDYMKCSVARFSFKEGLKRLKEQQLFWKNYNKKDLKLDEIRIENPYRQPRESSFRFMFAMERRAQEAKKNKM